jgi:hypothetical protein
VPDFATEDIGDRLHAAVRMPPNPFPVLGEIVGAKIVEEKERVVLLR